MGKDQSLKRLHDVRSEGCRSVITGVSRMSLLGDRDCAGCFPLCGDLLQIQAEVEQVFEDVTPLSGAGLQ